MTVAFAGLLVVWGNVVNYFVQPALPGGDWSAVAWGSALAIVSIAFARLNRLGASGLGLTARGIVRAALVGAGLGVAAGIVGVLVLRFAPAVIGAPVTYQPLIAVDDRALETHIVFFLPLAAVLPEELAFRGALLGALLQRRSATAAIAWSSTAFALWHLFVIYTTLLQTSLARTPLAWLAGSLALAVVFAGGVAFARLRIRSGTLAASVAAHWSFNTVVLMGLAA